MRITVALWGQLKREAGVGSIVLDLAGEEGTVETAIRALAAGHNAGLARLLVGTDGAVRRSTLVFRGDQQMPSLEDVLSEGDTITLMSPIAGG